MTATASALVYGNVGKQRTVCGNDDLRIHIFDIDQLRKHDGIFVRFASDGSLVDVALEVRENVNSTRALKGKIVDSDILGEIAGVAEIVVVPACSENGSAG